MATNLLFHRAHEYYECDLLPLTCAPSVMALIVRPRWMDRNYLPNPDGCCKCIQVLCVSHVRGNREEPRDQISQISNAITPSGYACPLDA